MSDSTSTPPARHLSGAESSTVRYMRWAGYAFLALAVSDFVESVVPPRFMNPDWELQLMAAAIERSPVAVLGFLFIFQAEWLRRARWERWLLPWISWGALASGVAFVLMIPLLITNTFRVDAGGEKQISEQLDQQMSQTKALQDAVVAAQGEKLADVLKQAGRIGDGKDPETARQEILAELGKARQELQRRAQEARDSQKLQIYKNTFKHTTQAAIVGAVLIAFWLGTGWARRTR